MLGHFTKSNKQAKRIVYKGGKVELGTNGESSIWISQIFRKLLENGYQITGLVYQVVRSLFLQNLPVIVSPRHGNRGYSEFSSCLYIPDLVATIHHLGFLQFF